MKTILFTIVFAFLSMTLSAQFVATVELKEYVEGICKQTNVYVLFPTLDGQEEAICPLTDEEILEKLNSEVAFLIENPKYKGKGMISIMINCKGEVVKCEMDTKTKSKKLDSQIVTVFNSLGEWKAGKLNGKEVDSMILISFNIKKGKVYFET